jgi:allophanate hydrolase subunit 1
MQNILQQMTGVIEFNLNNQEVAVIFDPQKIHYDHILEEILQAGYRVICFYVTEDDEGSTH